MTALTTRRLVAVLKKVPTRTFRIMELAPQLIDELGKVDVERCIDRQGELNLAIAEIEAYVKDSQMARCALNGIGGHPVDPEDFDEEGDE